MIKSAPPNATALACRPRMVLIGYFLQSVPLSCKGFRRKSRLGLSAWKRVWLISLPASWSSQLTETCPGCVEVILWCRLFVIHRSFATWTVSGFFFQNPQEVLLRTSSRMLSLPITTHIVAVTMLIDTLLNLLRRLSSST